MESPKPTQWQSSRRQSDLSFLNQWGSDSDVNPANIDAYGLKTSKAVPSERVRETFSSPPKRSPAGEQRFRNASPLDRRIGIILALFLADSLVCYIFWRLIPRIIFLIIRLIAEFPFIFSFLVARSLLGHKLPHARPAEHLPDQANAFLYQDDDSEGASYSDSDSGSEVSALNRMSDRIRRPARNHQPPIAIAPPVPVRRHRVHHHPTAIYNPIRTRRIPFRIHHRFSLFSPSSWRPNDNWTNTPTDYIPVRPSIWQCFKQTNTRFWLSVVEICASIANAAWWFIKLQRYIIPAVLALEITTAWTRGRAMTYPWFPRSWSQVKGWFWVGGETPGYGAVVGILEFWRGWVVGIGKVVFWRVPRWFLLGVWTEWSGMGREGQSAGGVGSGGEGTPTRDWTQKMG
ncbi:hypothetical protein T440DRAFT_556633 [Plenodomus tracheiphilus IPT5]|uniref:Uncharacterized protein n=1 Tax=Plenodomus tracheiphilus IPT5 TaxID=1408161 RepID=A0A6A7B2J5_9PLEO|nr:hypothetical protein T440DRAFT_556633 [Plenodomus tracheiphilus IPT5]